MRKVGAVAAAALVASAAAASAAPAVAPYVDVTGANTSMLGTAISSKGLRSFTAAFVTGSGCTPIWGDGQPVGSDPGPDGLITSAQAAGATAIVSFGGPPALRPSWRAPARSCRR